MESTNKKNCIYVLRGMAEIKLLQIYLVSGFFFPILVDYCYYFNFNFILFFFFDVIQVTIFVSYVLPKFVLTLLIKLLIYEEKGK